MVRKCGDAVSMNEKCPECGRVVEPSRTKPRRFCCSCLPPEKLIGTREWHRLSARLRAKHGPKKRDLPSIGGEAKICKGCDRPFLPWSRSQHPGAAGARCRECFNNYKRAKPSHQQAQAKKLAERHDSVPPRICPGCGDEHRHGGGSRCADCAHDHRKSLRSTAEARRLDAVRVGDRDIHWTLLGERDGWVCHICSKRVPKVAGTAEQPMGATVDHLIPIAHGGEHVWANVALAHRNCNISRGARGVAQLRLVG